MLVATGRHSHCGRKHQSIFHQPGSSGAHKMMVNVATNTEQSIVGASPLWCRENTSNCVQFQSGWMHTWTSVQMLPFMPIANTETNTLWTKATFCCSHHIQPTNKFSFANFQKFTAACCCHAMTLCFKDKHIDVHANPSWANHSNF